jgi:hypothetical protein
MNMNMNINININMTTTTTMNFNSLPECIVILIGSYLDNVENEKIIIRCEYFITRKIEILEEANEILSRKQYTKRQIAKVAEVFYKRHFVYPKSTAETQRNEDYQPKGCEYLRNTRNILIDGISGNIVSELETLKDTLKYNIHRPSQIFPSTSLSDFEQCKSSEVFRIYSLHNAYLLLSVCKYIAKTKTKSQINKKEKGK